MGGSLGQRCASGESFSVARLLDIADFDFDYFAAHIGRAWVDYEAEAAATTEVAAGPKPRPRGKAPRGGDGEKCTWDGWTWRDSEGEPHDGDAARKRQKLVCEQARREAARAERAVYVAGIDAEALREVETRWGASAADATCRSCGKPSSSLVGEGCAHCQAPCSSGAGPVPAAVVLRAPERGAKALWRQLPPKVPLLYWPISDVLPGFASEHASEHAAVVERILALGGRWAGGWELRRNRAYFDVVSELLARDGKDVSDAQYAELLGDEFSSIFLAQLAPIGEAWAAVMRRRDEVLGALPRRW